MRNNKRRNAKGDFPVHCAVVLTLSLTPVPTRNCRVYARSLSTHHYIVNHFTRNKTHLVCVDMYNPI